MPTNSIISRTPLVVLALGCLGSTELVVTSWFSYPLSTSVLSTVVGPGTPVAIISVFLFIAGIGGWCFCAVRLVRGKSAGIEKLLLGVFALEFVAIAVLAQGV